MIVNDCATVADKDYDVCIVGSGPAGLIAAFELERRGFEVLVVESGLDGCNKRQQQLTDAEIVDPRSQAPMDVASTRALGGTSRIWGGRCVAFDDVDFEPRPYVPHSVWPIRHEAVRPWYPTATSYLDCGTARFTAAIAEAPASMVGDGRYDALERWSNTPDLRQLHARAIEGRHNPVFCLGTTAIGLHIDRDAGHVDGLEVVTAANEQRTLRARAYVLAGGGLETARLLLVQQAEYPRLFGGTDGPLGRFYMGHLPGKLADITFSDDFPNSAVDFFVDDSGRYVRRRLSLSGEAQRRHELLNVVAWPDNPPLFDKNHGNPVLSTAYLALITPVLGPLLAPEATRRSATGGHRDEIPAHIRNVVLGLPKAMAFAARFVYARYFATTKLAGFFLLNPKRHYALHYFAEHAPNPDSRVMLSQQRDAVGMPRLRIDLRFSDIDARSILKSHALLDEWLRRQRLGRLNYRVPDAEQEAFVLAQANDGYHQIGTTRMAADPRHGVVDADCRVHGTSNLFVASSSVFPTSGQANPTLLIGAFSARLAAHLSQNLRSLPGCCTAVSARIGASSCHKRGRRIADS